MTFNAGIEAAARELEQSYPDNANTNAFCAAIRALTRPSSSASVEQREAVAREPFGYIYSFDGCMESTFSTERKSEYMRNEPWTETAVYTRPSQSDMEAACDALGEGIEILINLTNSIKEHGNYSEASTVNFIDQALQCFREATLSLPGSSRDEVLDHVVKFDECETPEPTLRKMILTYYMQGLQPDAELARKYADRFVLALIEGRT